MVSPCQAACFHIWSELWVTYQQAGQSEAQVHTDVVVQSPVVGRRVRAERAIPVSDFTLKDLTVVHQTATFFHFPGGDWADYIVQTNVPVTSVV